MRILSLRLRIVFFFTCTLLLAAVPAFADASSRIIVGYRSDTAFAQGAARFPGLSLTDYNSIPQIHARVFNVPDGASVQAIKDALFQDAAVSYVEVDRPYYPSLTPNDPCYGGNGSTCIGTGQPSWYFPLTNFPSAWDVTTGSGVTIAILDSGINCTEQDLVGKCVAGRNVTNSTDISASVNSDDQQHGTLVASVAGAAGNNGIQITGAAFDAKVMPVKITQPGQTFADASAIAAGITWAADHGVKIVNLSYGAGSLDTVIENAAGYLRSKGGILFQSAGNNDGPLSGPDIATIVNVSATDQNDQLASFSDSGPEVDFSAPGVSINAIGSDGNVYSSGGTSLSSPFAASVAALMLAKNPALLGWQIENIMQVSEHDLGPVGRDTSFGWGRIDAAASVANAFMTPPPDTTPPDPPFISSASSNNVSVTVSWSPSYDNTGAVSSYGIYRSGTQVGSVPAGTTTFTDPTPPSGSWSYTIRAVDPAGNVSIDSLNPFNVTIPPQSDTTPPSAPTNLAATPSATQVALSWSASTDNVGVTGYKVFRCTGTCTPTTQIGTSATNSYTDTSVTAGTTYSYQVTANDAAGNNSAASNTATATVPSAGDTTPPSAPTNLVGTPSATQVALSWTASTDNVGVTGYQIFRCTGTCTPTTQLATSATNSYTDTSVTAGTTYSYLVKATDAAGNVSVASNTVSATVPSGSDTQAPTAPKNLVASAPQPVALSWGASTDNVGVAGYKIFRCTGTFCSPTTQIGTSAANSYSDPTAAVGTTYRYGVKAYDAAGNLSALSNTVSVKVTQGSADTTPPSTPTNLTATPSTTQVALSWTASTDNVGVTGYQIFRCTGTCTPTTQLATSATNSYTDTSVTAGTTYSYLVKATDAAGNVSVASNTVSATVPSATDTQPPSTPANLAATTTGTQAVLTWNISTDNVGVSGYKILRCTGTCTPTTQLATSATNSYTDTSVSAGTTYSYQVQAFDAAGNTSAGSNIATVTVPSPADTTPPSVPTNLVATASSGQVVLTWTASTDNVGVVGYMIMRCTGSGCTSYSQINVSGTNSYTDTSVTAGTTYQYQVEAYDAANNISSPSNTAVATVPSATDTTPPSAPTNLVGTPSATQVALSWGASTDNVGVTGYQIFRCTGTCTPTTQLATSATNSYTDTSVTAGTTYSYLVKATDAAGNVSVASNTVSATVPSSTSLTISGISATAAIGFLNDTATFKWSTNLAATGKVSYGTSPTALTSSVNATTAKTSQSVSASGLKRQTTYYYQISATANGTTVQSAVLSFATP